MPSNRPRSSWCLAALVLTGYSLFGQTVGEGDLAIQGAYIGGSAIPLSQLTGTAFRFTYLIPKKGLVTGTLQTYAQDGGLRTGETGVGIEGYPWRGRYWDIRAGDFRLDTKLVAQPFSNLYSPNLLLRGVEVTTRHEGTSYSA